MPKVFAIFSRPNIQHAEWRERLIGFIGYLDINNVSYRLDEFTAGYLNVKPYENPTHICEGADAAIVFGGDGTILKTADSIPSNVPVLAINVGNLGFLTTTTLDKTIYATTRLMENDYETMDRLMIEVQVHQGKLTPHTHYALNDVVIKIDSGRTLAFDIQINRHAIAHYRADGVIIATPTGSTAYSLAAGGPIVYPSLKALVITPICPHTLTFRPVIVPDDATISIFAEPSKLYIDGSDFGMIDEFTEVQCKISNRTIKLIEPRYMGYFDVLREKLGWGK